MGKPIIAITAVKMTDAWYQLSKEEQDSLMAKVLAHQKQVPGVKNIVSARSLDVSWDFFLVSESVDIESQQKLDDLDAELNWRRYWVGTSFLGTREE